MRLIGQKLTYKTRGSVGFDIKSNENTVIKPGETKLISTGLYLDTDSTRDNEALEIRSRSGLASKGIIVTNSPGTIDNDYEQQIKIILTNLSKNNFTVSQGDRIAQGVIVKIGYLENAEREEQNRTGGFGSTGK